MYTPNTIFANRYHLIRKIGSGGFADVWQAADQMAEDTVVAVKIYVPDRGMDDRGIKQFRREYAGVMNLNHPNLLTARHFDIWEGRPYLIMPYISGGSLADRLMDEGTFDEAGIAKVLQDVGSALDYLHRKEVLHQDIKPDNILIGDEGQYLLTDFGISGRLRGTLRKHTGVQTSLTIAYAAPERFNAVPQSVPASDVFSLGVLAYELATGQLPWMGNGGLLLKQGAEVPELVGVMSYDLQKMIHQMMQLEPEVRPKAGEIVNYFERDMSMKFDKSKKNTELETTRKENLLVDNELSIDSKNDNIYQAKGIDNESVYLLGRAVKLIYASLIIIFVQFVIDIDYMFIDQVYYTFYGEDGLELNFRTSKAAGK